MKLTGLAPIHSSCKDMWGWGISGNYSAAHGFQEIHKISISTLSASIWKTIWNSRCIPKVNFFSWLTLHNKILTGDHLQKRRYHGPFRCCLCNAASETAAHILIECVFSQNVWSSILRGFQIVIPPQLSIMDFYLVWHDKRPSKSTASILHLIWHSILKLTWWYIWLAHNNSISCDQKLIFQVVVFKILSWFAEVVGLSFSSLPILSWSSVRVHAAGNPLNCSKPVISPSWRYRGSNEDFNFFWRKPPSAVIFLRSF